MRDYGLKDMQYNRVLQTRPSCLRCWVMKLGSMKRNGYGFCKNREYLKMALARKTMTHGKR